MNVGGALERMRERVSYDFERRTGRLDNRHPLDAWLDNPPSPRTFALTRARCGP